MTEEQRAKRIAAISARRAANPNHPHNVLSRVIARRIAEGAPVIVAMVAA